MTGPDSDDELLVNLRAAIEADLDDVPVELTAFARDIGEWAVVEDTLAKLVEVEEALVRAPEGDQRSLSFSAPPYAVMVTLDAEGLVGEVSPAPYPELVLQTGGSGATIAIEIDQRGRFRVPGAEVPFRLRLRRGAQRFTTPWVTH
jgi:hypothetical protein